jgi:copper chaperone CopZ
MEPGGPALSLGDLPTYSIEVRMKPLQLVALSTLCGLLVLPAPARTETKIELKGVHLCCGACIKAVNGVLKTVDGVKGVCDQQARTITITAPDDETAQKALDALAAAGFHGDTGSKTLVMKEDSGVQAGKVKSLTVTGVHNCCAQCTGLIKSAVKKVDGAKEITIKPRATTFEVAGDFDAAELVKTLNGAGFHVKIKH